MNLVLNLLVVVATVLGSGMALPQVRRIVRTGSVEGVSPIWIGVSMAINGWWFAYAYAETIVAMFAVSSISLLLYGTMAVGYLRADGRRGIPGLAVGAFGLGMIPLPFLLAGGWATAGVVIGLCYGIQLLPAVVAACRSAALAGVSAATWLIAWIESVIWGLYGVAIADSALLIGGIVGVLMSSIILVRLAITGHRPLAVFGRLRPVLA